MTMPKFEPVAQVVEELGTSKKVIFNSNKALYETPLWIKLYTADQLTEAYEAGKLEQAAQIEMMRDFIETAPVSTGVCCCGESMEGHSSPMNCGHTPVDLWDHSVISVLSATPNEALAQFAAKVREQVIEACSDGTGPSGNLLPLSTVAKIRAIKEIP